MYVSTVVCASHQLLEVECSRDESGLSVVSAAKCTEVEVQSERRASAAVVDFIVRCATCEYNNAPRSFVLLSAAASRRKFCTPTVSLSASDSARLYDTSSHAFEVQIDT